MVRVPRRVDEAAPGWLAAFRAMPEDPQGRRLDLLATPAGCAPAIGEEAGCAVIFDGHLYNRSELLAQLAGDEPPPGDATLVARAYGRWGEGAIARLKGVFAVLIADRGPGGLRCARDPLGVHPLFYAETAHAVLVSPAIETLLDHADVSRELNRACLVDRLRRHWTVNDETYFRRVRRVPPGHILRVGGGERRAHRYWDPLPPTGAVEWIADDEVQARFDTLLREAIARCLPVARVGVYASGGLDSSTLAWIGSELATARGAPPPCALSLVFSEADGREAARQRELSAALGLPHVQLAYDAAAGSQGSFEAALEMTRSMPAPLAVFWRPALHRLAREARGLGCEVILAGDGADEWLSVNPIVAADLLRRVDLAGLHRLWRLYARSYHFTSREAARLVMWRHGVQPLLADIAARAARLGGPGLAHRLRHRRALRDAAMPAWLAPEPQLHGQLVERLEAWWLGAAARTRGDGLYLADTRLRLDAAEKWFREEETFLCARRGGIAIREPFWDPALIACLVRVRPEARSAGGLAKALVRQPLARRFPGLGFEQQRKSNIGTAFLAALARDAAAVRRAMGDVPTLVSLGIVDGPQVRGLLDRLLAGGRGQLGWVWELFNLEAWCRAHA